MKRWGGSKVAAELTPAGDYYLAEVRQNLAAIAVTGISPMCSAMNVQCPAHTLSTRMP